jgi:hypothetical protein
MKLGRVEHTVAAILHRLRSPDSAVPARGPAAAPAVDIDLGELAALPVPASPDGSGSRPPRDSASWRTQPGVRFLVSGR